jgi:cobalt-precorrin 5A hydrolase
MIVAGIGCKIGTSCPDIIAVFKAALVEAKLDARDVGALATSAHKGREVGIVEFAKVLNLPLLMMSQEAMEAAGERALTYSDRVATLMNVPSVAETAALAAAGEGSQLLAARVVLGTATCAFAQWPQGGAG